LPKPHAIEIHGDALAEARDGARWYARRSRETARRFRVALASAFELIAENPEAGSRIGEDLDPARRLRQVMVRRYPYAVVYGVDGDKVIVFAIAHQRRQPGYWAPRVVPG